MEDDLSSKIRQLEMEYTQLIVQKQEGDQLYMKVKSENSALQVALQEREE